MKRVLYVLSVIVLGSIYTSCGDDNGYEIPASKLNIVRSDVLFEAPGGEGSIEVDAPQALSAVKADKDWCTATVSGMTVKVRVSPNESIEGRNANIVITSGNDSRNVVVTQNGQVFYVDAPGLVKISLDGAELSYPVHNDFPVEISASESWITAEIRNGVLEVSASSSEVKRSGEITVKGNYAEGEKIRTIVISQEIFTYKHFLGEWTLAYINTIAGYTTPSSMDVQLLENEDGKSYRLGPVSSRVSDSKAGSGYLVVDYSVGNETNTFKISGGQALPDYSVYNVKVVAWNADNSFNTSGSITYQGTYIDNNGIATIQFADNGSWSGSQVNGLLIGAFNKSTAAYAGWLYSMDHVVMTRK